MKKTFVFGAVSFALLSFLFSFTLDNKTNLKTNKKEHCYEFRVTCAGKSGFYETVPATSWGEATTKINARYPNCKAIQVKQKDC